MKQILKHVLSYLLIGTGIFFSCKKDFASFGEINNPLIVNAGSDQSNQLPIDHVLLDASASKNPDGIISLAIKPE